MRFRLAVRYSIDGDLRFISHHDTLRLFERALARAGLPVRFSEGFNPRPRIRLALPRPVGVASSDELLVVEFVEAVDESTLLNHLARQMPAGIALLTAERLTDQDPRRPCEARYVLSLEPDEAAPLAQRVESFLERPCVMVQRTVFRENRARSIDLRAFICDMQVTGSRLIWTQTISQDGSARLGEVLEAVGLSPQDHLAKVRRESVRYAP